MGRAPLKGSCCELGEGGEVAQGSGGTSLIIIIIGQFKSWRKRDSEDPSVGAYLPVHPLFDSFASSSSRVSSLWMEIPRTQSKHPDGTLFSLGAAL